MDNKTGRTVDITFVAAMFVMALLYLVLRAPFRLDFKEQISIFLFDADRISWYLSNPAVVSSVIGDWLTQFYTNRVMAPTLSVILFAAIIIGLKDFFRKAEPNRIIFTDGKAPQTVIFNNKTDGSNGSQTTNLSFASGIVFNADAKCQKVVDFFAGHSNGCGNPDNMRSFL